MGAPRASLPRLDRQLRQTRAAQLAVEPPSRGLVRLRDTAWAMSQDVVVTVEGSARIRGSDSKIKTRIWHVWRMRDGLACEGRAYGTRREASEAAGLPE
jgi:hypothetical protein